MCSPSVLIADEPTRGVDVGAKRAIYDLLVEMAKTEWESSLSPPSSRSPRLAHRTLVMRHGRITAELTGDDMNEQAVLAAAFPRQTPPEETR